MGFRITQRNATRMMREAVSAVCATENISFKFKKRSGERGGAQVGGLQILNRDRSIESARFVFKYHVRLAAATVPTVVGEAQEREGLWFSLSPLFPVASGEGVCSLWVRFPRASQLVAAKTVQRYVKMYLLYGHMSSHSFHEIK